MHARDAARAAAVVAILFTRREAASFELRRDLRVLLTLRPQEVGRHAGQVCFPGGVLDANETHRDAAGREAEEEVGIDRESLRWLGPLSEVFIPVSGYLVRPFVAAVDPAPVWRPAPAEVARVLEFPLASLAEPSARGARWERRRGVDVHVPYYRVAGEEVWGATAMMLAELELLFEGVLAED